MAVIIKGDVHGDVISDGGVKNETHFHYADEHRVESNIKKQEMHQNTNNTLNAVSHTHQVMNISLTPVRQSILEKLLILVDKGDWRHEELANIVKEMLRTVLGQGKTQLLGNEAEQSETLWHLLENGRGDRVIIVWQNLVGYLDDKQLFRQKGSPALNKDFFGDDKGYTNIDKGRPNKGLMTPDFESIIPLLDAYVPKLDKKA